MQVSGLSYSYGAKKALDVVSFRVPDGVFCALLGPNGAGKTTLFNLLTRLFLTPSGDIRITGIDLRTEPREALSRIGVVFQQPTLELDLTVRQNLSYFAALHGLAGKRAQQRIDVCLERLDIRDRAAERVRGLNGGHRRRAEIARALVPDPDVLLLDEPTVGLDAAARAAITKHAHDLAGEGRTVFWATHLTDEIGPEDHLVILHRAKVLCTGTAAAICNGQNLQDRFLELTQTGDE